MALLSTLRDKFDATTFASQWTTFTSLGASVSMSGGKAICTLNPSTASSDAEIGSTALDYDLTGNFGLAQVLQVAPGANSETDLQLLKDGSNLLYMQRYADGNLYGVVISGGVQIFNANIVYNAATMKWWRIKESGGTVFFDYSADGINWANLGSTATPTFGVTALKVKLAAFEDASDVAAGSAWFANFNVPPIGRLNNSGTRPHSFSPGLAR